MASSGSYARGDQPRSVPDANAALYDAAAKQQRAYNERQAAEIEKKRLLGDRLFTLADTDAPPDVGHPGTLESFIPVWGSGRESLADLHDGNTVGAYVNAGLAASDVFLGKAVLEGLVKGGWKLAPAVWRASPEEVKQGIKGARQVMTDSGFAKRGQHVHHWAIPQNGWGKEVPGEIKNHMWNGKPMESAAQHGRMHGPYTINGVRLPEFNDLEKFWYGTPDWFKALNVSLPGHAGTAVGRALQDRSP